MTTDTKGGKWGLVGAMVVAALALWAGSARAVHESGVFDCSTCHAMHQAHGQDGAYGGSLEYYNQWEDWGVGQDVNDGYGRRLLKTRRSSYFCLQCHDLSSPTRTKNPGDPDPPAVVNTANPANPPGVPSGAGGYFYGMASLPTVGSPFQSPNAHDLDREIAGHPGSSSTETEILWCRNCHHHHGTRATDTTWSQLPKGDPLKNANPNLEIDSFRNLIVPRGDASQIWGREISYTNTYYSRKLENFCERCHDQPLWGASLGFHPEGMQIGIANSGMAAGNNYMRGMDDTDLITSQPIIKPQDVLENDNRSAANFTARDPGADDVVTCLTCHYAHGGPYAKMLRWDYGNYLYTWNDPYNDTRLGKGISESPTAGSPGAGCQMCHAR
ncbi:MAG: hypothetical protein HYY20_08870 [Candidatus Tectomicrobia bacterium]|uniref:Doubled CXXCH motif domain-containing protein n=1 Tax=Tectimicrobiota bacterium TaxID=2528274 RepID=A0A932CPL2_UNCTE|nr:hypothetical protein [Candidatus Tectomicrobia bacterium]